MHPLRSGLLASLALSLVACSSAPPPAVAPPAPPPEAAAPVAPTSRPQTEAAAPPSVPEAVRAIVATPDRIDADREIDPGRHPGEMLAFFGVGPGMKVADLAAGGGYTTELLARAVGPSGVVYGQNPAMFLQFAGKNWSERLAKPVMKNVVRVDREMDDPLPPEAHDLDAVFFVLVYHDTVWIGVDREKLNSSVFKALKPGGTYAIIDHSGRVGTGTSETKTLHRIEESAVVAEVQKAGFKLAAEGAFLRNPKDLRDWNDSPKVAAERRGTSDRFVLKFIKP